MAPFEQRVRDILYQRKIPIIRFSEETGIDRKNFFYKRNRKSSHSKHIHMAIAYYFEMTVDELIAGTDAEIDWYGDHGV